METFTSSIPHLKGLTFSSTGIVWNENGTRKQIHSNGRRPYIHVKEYRFYLSDVYEREGFKYEQKDV